MCLGRQAWLCVSLAAGCSSSAESADSNGTTVGACLERFSASNGYGYSVDRGAVTSRTAMPEGSMAGAGAQLAPNSTLQRAIHDCTNGVTDGSGAHDGAALPSAAGANATPLPGTNCEFPSLMTHDAALCVAGVHGLAEELGYAATIAYRSEYGRIVWMVSNTIERSADVLRGELMTIDATSGQMLELTSWGARK